MAIYSKYTEVQYNGNTVMFGSLTKAQQQEILDADYANEEAMLNNRPITVAPEVNAINTAKTQTAGDAVVTPVDNPFGDPIVTPVEDPFNEEETTTKALSDEEESFLIPNEDEEQPELLNDDEESFLLESEDDAQDIEQLGGPDDEEPELLGGPSEDENDWGDSPTEQDVLDYEARHSKDAKTSAVDAKTSVPQYKIVSNPLHAYPTYTYGLTLYLLDSTEFNTIASDPKSWTPKNVLISSAGRYEKNMPRNANFKDDFYFEEFKMQTVIGLNSKSKASNAIDFNFSIVEPYGLTLLNRIIDASKLANTKNYLDMPYLLQVDFFGNDETGNTLHPIPNLTKRFPIKLISMKIKVGVKGAEYAIQAVPFNHSAFQQTQATTPTNFNVTAGTVGAFFANGATELDTAKREAAKKTIEDEDRAVAQDENGGGKGKNSQAYESAQKTLNSPYDVNSYVAGFNSYYEYLKKTGARKTVEKIEVIVSPSIAGSSIVKADKSKVSVKPMANNAKTAAAAKNDSGAAVDDTQSGFAINNGTSILAVIDQVMANSEWLQRQLKDANDSAEDTKEKVKKPMQYYKVIPQIKLEEFDELSGRWNKTTTYYIEDYTVYNAKYPGAPEAAPPGPVKEYNYIYTGKNTDIINFDIDFNTAFYTAVTVDRANYDKALGGATKDTPDENKESAPKADVAGVQPQVYQYQSTNPSATIGMDSIKDSKTIKARDVQNSIYTKPGGDMISLKLRIIGDPHFIKQDDIYTNPSNTDYAAQVKGQLIESNQSLVTDRGEIFCTVNFKTPVDMDELTGLPRNDTKYSSSVFSGIYKVLLVDNEFRGGKFEQTLELVRAFGQEKAAAQEEAARGSAADGKNSKTASPYSLSLPTLGDQEGDYPEYPGGSTITDDSIELEDTGWENQDGLMVSDEDNDNELVQLGGPSDDDEPELLSGEDISADDEEEFNQLSEIDATTETVDVVDWENSGTRIETNQLDVDF